MGTLAPAYRPRRPTETVLYAVVRDWLETFLAHARETYEAPVPAYVERELRGYLRCGVFAHGFVRAHCDTCGHDLLVAFSCKARAVCPSCAGRRMANVAAFRADVLSALSRIFHDAVFARYGIWATTQGLGKAPTGAACHVQRFGSSINLHVHFHSMVLDGVFTRDASGRPVFHPAPVPRGDELDAILRRVRARTMTWLHRHGLLDAEGETEHERRTPLDACASVAMQRGSLRNLRHLGEGEEGADGASSTPLPPTQDAAVDLDGFNLHASVGIGAEDDLGRERLMRYGARPPLALERLRRLPDGRLAYRVKKLRDGRAKHRVMTPLEFLARLAALVPPPRYPLLRYVGVLGPRSNWRRDIAPQPRRQADGCAPEHADRQRRADSCPPASSAKDAADAPTRRPARRAPAAPPEAEAGEPHPESRWPTVPLAEAAALVRTASVPLAANIVSVEHWNRLLGGLLYTATPRLDWVTLLRRSFEVDVLACTRCGGRLRVLGEVTEPTAVRLVLESLGLPTEAPRAARARDPTELLAQTDGW